MSTKTKMDWTRDTLGVFQVWENDLAELRDNPAQLTNIGSCEPEEFEVMALPDVTALGVIIIEMYDRLGDDSELTRSATIQHEGEIDDETLERAEDELNNLIAFDCREWLKPEFKKGQSLRLIS